MKITQNENFFPGISQFLQTVNPPKIKKTSKTETLQKALQNSYVERKIQLKNANDLILVENLEQDFENTLEALYQEYLYQTELDFASNVQSYYELAELLN